MTPPHKTELTLKTHFGKASLAFAGGIALVATLLGCAIPRDRNFYYISERGKIQIRFYDTESRKWVALTGKTAKFFICQDGFFYQSGWSLSRRGKRTTRDFSGGRRGGQECQGRQTC